MNRRDMWQTFGKPLAWSAAQRRELHRQTRSLTRHQASSTRQRGWGWAHDPASTRRRSVDRPARRRLLLAQPPQWGHDQETGPRADHNSGLSAEKEGLWHAARSEE